MSTNIVDKANNRSSLSQQYKNQIIIGINTYIRIEFSNMILSKKTRYAIVALTRLAKEFGKGPVLIREIAEEEKIPQRFLENILLELKKLGILGSKLGKDGGYFLIRNPEDVSILDIVRYFEGTIALLYCVSEKAYRPCEFCRDEKICGIRSVFKEVRDSTFQILSKTTLQSLIK
jgi:Rrf2 family protein